MLRLSLRFIHAAWAVALLVLVAGGTPCRASTYNLSYDELGRLTGMVDSTGNAATYNYDAVGNIVSVAQGNAPVSIVGFTPGRGPAGVNVAISGYGFSPTASQNTVTFNGAAATVSSASATQLVAQVPAGASTGPISVSTPNGSATSATSFTVAAGATPAISGFSPTIGAAGTAVTVTGSNFATTVNEDNLTFNTRQAVVRTASATTLTSSVPSSGTSGRLTVATPYGQAASAQDFFVPPSPYTASSVAVTGRIAIGASQTVTLSAAGTIGLNVFDGSAGQRVSLLVTSSSVGACYGGSIQVRKPDGSTLASAALCSGSFTGGFVLPVTGTYTILIAPSSSAAGSVTFTLYNAPDVTGTITPGGAPVTLTIATPGQGGSLTFTGSASQRVSLTIGTNSGLGNGGSYISIVNPDGTYLLNRTPFYSLSYFSDVLTLPAAGTYTIRFDPNSANTGTATFTLYNVPADPTGTITPGGAATTLTITNPGQDGSLTFTGSASQRVSLAISTDSGLANPGSYISIVNPDGTYLLNRTPFYSSSYFSDVLTLPAAGTYTIRFDPLSTNTGAATFTLYNVPPDPTGTITPGGSAVALTITTPGQDGSLTFSGTASQRVSLTISTGSGLASCNYVTIVNPDGTYLLNRTLSCGASYYSDVLTLPGTGTYTIRLDPGGVSTGTATFTLYNVPPDPTGTITPGGATATLIIATPGQDGSLTFSGSASQRVSLAISTDSGLGSYCSLISIVNPDSTYLLNRTLFCGASYYSDVLVLPAAGTYTVRFDPYSTNTGTATFTLYNVPPDATGTIIPGGAAAALTITTPGQDGSLTFSGSASQRVSLAISTDSGLASSCSYISIVNPDGTYLLNRTLFCAANYTGSTLTLPAAGTYTIRFDPYSTNTGTATFTLSSQ